MKKVKSFILTGIITMVMLTMYSPTNAVAGPFETYLDCVDVCVTKYEAWTLRRTACGADCYVNLVRDVVKELSPF
jgi:hypothetical protein